MFGDIRGGYSHGEQSTRENKTIYQICRSAGSTRLEEEKMTAVLILKLKNLNMKCRNLHLMILSRWQTLTGDQISAIITALINAKSVTVGVPEVEVSDLSNIILETIASLNEIILTTMSDPEDCP